MHFSDNGCGIHEQELPLIFDPFYTTARDSGAVGLGLHLVFNLVTQNLGGCIECTSEPNKGTTFTITLPVNSERDPQTQQAESKPQQKSVASLAS